MKSTGYGHINRLLARSGTIKIDRWDFLQEEFSGMTEIFFTNLAAVATTMNEEEGTYVEDLTEALNLGDYVWFDANKWGRHGNIRCEIIKIVTRAEHRDVVIARGVVLGYENSTGFLHTQLPGEDQLRQFRFTHSVLVPPATVLGASGGPTGGMASLAPPESEVTVKLRPERDGLVAISVTPYVDTGEACARPRRIVEKQDRAAQTKTVVAQAVEALSMWRADGLTMRQLRDSMKRCPNISSYIKYSHNYRLLRLNPDKIVVLDATTGQPTNSIKLPGRYILRFDDMEIVGSQPLDFLVGDVRVQLVDVPLFGTLQALPSAVPKLKPATSWRAGDFVDFCDDQSHKVTVDGSYCRYCDLCHVSAVVESKLISGRHKVLPNLNREGSFGLNCSRFYPGEQYSLQRTIDMANPRDTQNNLPTIPENVGSAFEQGEGTMQVNLRLLHKTCKVPAWCSDLSSRFLPQCQCDANENRNYCLRTSGFDGSYRLAACYNIEFKYAVAAFDKRTRTTVCPTEVNQGPSTKVTNTNGCPLWCCNRPIEFVRSFNCPTDCVFRTEAACSFPLL